MRVALVLSSSTGGIGRHVVSLVPRLVARGNSVRVYCPDLTRDAHALGGLGIDVHPLTKLWGARSADVVHAHGFKAGALALTATRFGGPPVVVSWHNAVLGHGRQVTLGHLLQRVVARGADLTLGASSDLVVEALRLGARAARLGPVAAPVLGAAQHGRDTVRVALGLDPHDVFVLTVGRLAPQKNLDMILDTAQRLAGAQSPVFAIVGEGPERARLQTRIDTDRLPVRLLGARDDIADLLAAADLAFLTSTWEARALVAQEALLAGLPLVSTRVGGIAELVGEAAVLVGAGDDAAAAAAIEALVDDPAARTALAAAGRVQAAGWPDEDDVAADVEAAYQEVLGPRATGHGTQSGGEPIP